MEKQKLGFLPTSGLKHKNPKFGNNRSIRISAWKAISQTKIILKVKRGYYDSENQRSLHGKVSIQTKY